MKKIKEVMDLDEIEVTKVFETVLQATYESDDDTVDKYVIEEVSKKYKNEPKKAMLGFIFCAVKSEDDLYKKMVVDITNNVNKMMQRIVG